MGPREGLINPRIGARSQKNPTTPHTHHQPPHPPMTPARGAGGGGPPLGGEGITAITRGTRPGPEGSNLTLATSVHGSPGPRHGCGRALVGFAVGCCGGPRPHSWLKLISPMFKNSFLWCRGRLAW